MEGWKDGLQGCTERMDLRNVLEGRIGGMDCRDRLEGEIEGMDWIATSNIKTFYLLLHIITLHIIRHPVLQYKIKMALWLWVEVMVIQTLTCRELQYSVGEMVPRIWVGVPPATVAQ
jgi:hypothetical protein